MQQSRQERETKNLEAHTSKLKSKLQDIVKQTHEAVEVKEGYLLEVANLETELTQKTQEYNRVFSAVVDLEKKRDLLQGELSNLEALKIQSIADGQDKIKSLDRELATKRAQIESLQKRVDRGEGERQKELDGLIQAAEKKRQELSDVTDSTEKGKEVLEGIKQQIEGALVILDNTLAYTDQITADTNAKVIELKVQEEKIRKANENNKQETEAIKQERADLEVYKNRIIKEHKRVFPDREIVLNLN